MSTRQPPAEAQAQGGGEALEAELIALVAGPYHYHHKMDEHAEREGKAFDRCRELTIQNIRTWCATRRAMLAAQPPSAPVGVEVASLPALWRLREDNGEERTEYDQGYEQASDECADALERALAQQPAAEAQGGGEAVVCWLRHRPDGTPDWSEDCVSTSTHFLDHELESDGYTIRPLVYGDTAPPSAPVGVEQIIATDEAGWALAKRAEVAGAERDSDDNGTWWTLRIEQFKAIAQQPAADTLNAGRLKALHRGLELARKWATGTGVLGHTDTVVRSMAEELRVALSSQEGDYDQQPAACEACGGRGEVGGLTLDGYESHPCPKCEEQPAAVDGAMVERAAAAVMSAPPEISVEAYVRIVLEAALAAQPGGDQE